MKIYIVCKLDGPTGYIIGVDPYDTIERAINRAKVIIKDSAVGKTIIDNVEKYLRDFQEDGEHYLKNCLSYEDEYGLVRILVKDM